LLGEFVHPVKRESKKEEFEEYVLDLEGSIAEPEKWVVALHRNLLVPGYEKIPLQD
jgi:hypothetical protein